MRLAGLRGMLFSGVLMGTSLLSQGVLANSDEMTSLLRDLGGLNGQSLACDQAALSVRARQLVIDYVPKERGLGELFEEATNAAFLLQGQSKSPCPESKVLAERIRSVEATLKARQAKKE